MDRAADYDYDLPRDLIAQEPAATRERSRALFTHRGQDTLQPGVFADLLSYFTGNECLVVNDTRVIPARLQLRRETGGKIELFLLRREEAGRWRAWLSPSRRLKLGERLYNDALQVELVDRGGDFWLVDLGADDLEQIATYGEVPLPPYIERQSSDPRLQRLDAERYQTVFAQTPGAVAAPTAGLHFSLPLLDAIAELGVPVVRVTLHVGPGTFRPIMVDHIAEHSVAAELFEVSAAARRTLSQAVADGRDLIAVGTTSLRVLESLPTITADVSDQCEAVRGETDLTILPGYEFKHVAGLITNFHLPRSSLLVLVSAFHGFERTRRCYQRAIAEAMRFYSYGDAMVILPATAQC